MWANERTFYIDALGCITNRVDAARVQMFFNTNGWTTVEKFEEARLIVLMTCGFTKASEDYNIERLKDIKRGKRDDAQIIVGGCLPSINKERLSEVFDGFVFSPRTLGKLNDFIPSEVKIEQVAAASAPLANEKEFSAVRISTGCMSHCTYCAIPFANGRTVSRSMDEILDDIRDSVARGVKRIKLVSEDAGAYGQEKKQSIIALLKFIVDSDVDAEIYIDSLNPNWFYLYRSEMLDLLHSPKMAKSLSIPVQSGSDRVLNLMKREYTVSQVKEVVSLVYEFFPDFRLSTDFIVGFPGETEQDFAATRTLLEECDFHHVQIFTYEERPRIAARHLEMQLPKNIKEERRQILFQDFLKKFLSMRGIASVEQLRAVLDTYEKLPINFNLVLM